jgi:hypothetical protein
MVADRDLEIGRPEGDHPNRMLTCVGQRVRVVARAILRWLQTAAIETAFIDTGKPWQNGADESFNGTFPDQHLSLQRFRNCAHAKASIQNCGGTTRPCDRTRVSPAAFKAKDLADVDGGRSPATQARADVTKNEERLTSSVSAVLQ